MPRVQARQPRRLAERVESFGLFARTVVLQAAAARGAHEGVAQRGEQLLGELTRIDARAQRRFHRDKRAGSIVVGDGLEHRDASFETGAAERGEHPGRVDVVLVVAGADRERHIELRERVARRARALAYDCVDHLWIDRDASRARRCRPHARAGRRS